MKILVSACLLGSRCRYDGGSKLNQAVLALGKRYEFIPVCPEVMGGLMIPHPPAERVGNCVVNAEGVDVTGAFIKGAEEALKKAQEHHCQYAILKERSPSSGKGMIYDGTFSKHLTAGYGVTAELLMNNGVKVFGESELSALEAAIGLDN